MVKEIASKLLGQKPAHPKGIKGECVCFIRMACDFMGIPQFKTIKGAKDLVNVYDHNFFELHTPSLFFIPRDGDIFVMNYPAKTGHTGWVSSFNILTRKVTSYDANWHEDGKIYQESHDQSHIIGYLRPKLTQEVVKGLFRYFWGRDPLEGEWRVFWYRVLLGDVKDVPTMYSTVDFWHGKSLVDDERWQQEKTIITNRAQKAGL